MLDDKLDYKIVNRRFYLKTIAFGGIASLTSFSIFKWIDVHRPVDPEYFWSKRDLIAELSELIIPKTDTPGAKDAGVNVYIINVMIHCNPDKQQRRFISGLENLEKYAIDHFGKNFLDCSNEVKIKVLEYFANQAMFSNVFFLKVSNKLFSEPFYAKLRSLTIDGYCQSQLGATRGLAYDYIPGNFEACSILKNNQKSWATK